MDIIDQAQMYQERDTEIAIKSQLRFKKTVPSTGYCEECGDIIPAERVRAINASTCITCAKLEEQRLKKWGV